MSVLNSIIRENVIKQAITKEEYEKAQNEMPDEDFKKQYEGDSYNFFKLAYADEKEISILLLDRINSSISLIKGWVIFFGILTILGIIGDIIFYVNFMKLFDLFH